MCTVMISLDAATCIRSINMERIEVSTNCVYRLEGLCERCSIVQNRIFGGEMGARSAIVVAGSHDWW